MTETSNSPEDIEHTDILSQLDLSDVCPQPGRADTQAAAAGIQDHTANTTAASIAALENELALTKATLREREQGLQRRVQELQEQLLQQTSAVNALQQQLSASNANGAAKGANAGAQDSFGMVLTLSSEREAALRERKLYKDRAADAEANAAQLESDLAAAHANAKLQTERANKLAARGDELQRLLQARDNRIAELDRQLTDRIGTPTLVGGDLERLALGASPRIKYALESLDTPGQMHKLAHPTNSVGRNATNDIQLNSASVSRFHARLLNKPEGMWLIDLQSSNGCQVNGQRISEQILNEGDLVMIGECRFRFSTVK